MRPSTLVELAERAGIAVPVIRGFGSFTAFSATYLAACEVLRTPEDLARLVYEWSRTRPRGAVWMEPAFYAAHHRHRFGTDGAIMDMVLERRRRGRLARRRGGADAGGRPDRRTRRRRWSRPASPHSLRRPGRGVVRAGQRRGDRAAGALRRGLRRGPRGRTPLHAPRRRAGRTARGGALDPLGADRIQHGVRPDRGPGAGEAPRRQRHVPRRVPHLQPAARGGPVARGAPAAPLLDAGFSAASTPTTRCCSGPACWRSTSWCAPRWGSTTVAMATIARASIDSSGTPDRAQVVGPGWGSATGSRRPERPHTPHPS